MPEGESRSGAKRDGGAAETRREPSCRTTKERSRRQAGAAGRVSEGRVGGIGVNERERESASERRRQKGDQRGAGIATESPLRNEQLVERASAGCWLLAAADYDGAARLCVVDETRTR